MSSVPPDLQDFIDAKLASGSFQSVDEIAFAAMRALRDKEERHAQLKRDIADAQAEIAAGLVEDWEVDSIKRELRAEFPEWHDE